MAGSTSRPHLTAVWQVTPADFSVMISGLPEETFDASALADFLSSADEEMADIIAASLSFNCRELMLCLNERVQLRVKEHSLQAQIYLTRRDLYAAHSKAQQARDSKPVTSVTSVTSRYIRCIRCIRCIRSIRCIRFIRFICYIRYIRYRSATRSWRVGAPLPPRPPRRRAPRARASSRRTSRRSSIQQAAPRAGAPMSVEARRLRRIPLWRPAARRECPPPGARPA